MDHELEKQLVLHLLLLMVLMKKLVWVIQIARLIFIVKDNLKFPCLYHELEKKLLLHLILLMVPMKKTGEETITTLHLPHSGKIGSL